MQRPVQTHDFRIFIFRFSEVYVRTVFNFKSSRAYQLSYNVLLKPKCNRRNNYSGKRPLFFDDEILNENSMPFAYYRKTKVYSSILLRTLLIFKQIVLQTDPVGIKFVLQKNRYLSESYAFLFYT